ncbi:MAG: pantetheine-phosphate adenylyltransferase [Alphaproteobacteria bacterium]|nr:pantetheine-phosphate adenylyltransferase [Alphaproteobacteria bacterium]
MKKTIRKNTSSTQLIGLYPGTFDPITLGHTDIILRAANVVQKLVIGVADNAGKGPLFSLKDRIKMVEDEVAKLDTKLDIEVRPFKNLLVHFATEVGAKVVIRGLRAVSDFEYEFQMAAMNRKIAPELETVFLMSSDKYQFISSRFVKEIARLGGDVSPFVSDRVLKHIARKID